MIEDANINDLSAILEPYIDYYKLWMKSADYRDLLEERNGKSVELKQLLDKSRIPKLMKEDISMLISGLWSLHNLGARRYVREIVELNDVRTIRASLYDLIWGDEDIELRFNRMVENIRGVGPGVTSELLFFVNPNRYVYWSEKTRSALRELRLMPELTEVAQINGKQFKEICRKFILFHETLPRFKLQIRNNLDVDLFLWWISQLRLEVDSVVELIQSINKCLTDIIDREVVIENHQSMLEKAWYEAQSNIDEAIYKLESPGEAVHYHPKLREAGLSGEQMRFKTKVYKEVKKIFEARKRFSPVLFRDLLRLINTLLHSISILAPGIDAISEIKDFLEVSADLKIQKIHMK